MGLSGPPGSPLVPAADKYVHSRLVDNPPHGPPVVGSPNDRNGGRSRVRVPGEQAWRRGSIDEGSPRRGNRGQASPKLPLPRALIAPCHHVKGFKPDAVDSGLWDSHSVRLRMACMYLHMCTHLPTRSGDVTLYNAEQGPLAPP